MPDVARAALDAAIAATSAADAGSGAAVAEAAAGAGTTSPAGRAAGAAISPTLATALAAARAAHAAAVAANRAPASESTMPAGAAGIRNQGAAPQGAVPPQATAAAPGAMAQSIAAAVAAATRSTGGTPAGKTAGKSAESSFDRAGASAAGVSAAGASLLAAAAAHAGLLAGSAPGAAADVVVAGAPLDVPMPSPAEGTAEQIVQTLRLQAADGGGIAEIRLQPEQFGHLTISLHVTDGLVSARLQADSAAARDWLQANADALRHGLSTHDLTLDRLEIAEPPSTPSPSDRRGTGDRAFRDQPPPRRQPRRTPSGAGETFELIA
jgi:flagellar hook-length control protein FliK